MSRGESCSSGQRSLHGRDGVRFGAVSRSNDKQKAETKRSRGPKTRPGQRAPVSDLATPRGPGPNGRGQQPPPTRTPPGDE